MVSVWEGLGFLVNSINIERSTEAVFEIGFEEGWGVWREWMGRVWVLGRQNQYREVYGAWIHDVFDVDVICFALSWMVDKSVKNSLFAYFDSRLVLGWGVWGGGRNQKVWDSCQ